MGENSNIECTDHTVNFVIGCVEKSEECANCYARTLDRRYKWGDGKEHWGKDAPRYVRAANALKECLALNAKAKAAGRIDRVFINSLSDTFEDRGDLETARTSLYDAVQKCGNLVFQLLTKRPENVRRFVPSVWLDRWPENAWIGTTTGLQKTADIRIPELLKIPAKVRFLSMEPLLGPVDLRLNDRNRAVMENGPQCGAPWISWVICGGESGPNARPMHPDQARSIRDQCQAAGVPFFFKQFGEWLSVPSLEHSRSYPGAKLKFFDSHGETYARVGKKAAGRLLDGKEWSEFPA